jgi:hypothetical protein
MCPRTRKITLSMIVVTTPIRLLSRSTRNSVLAETVRLKFFILTD